MAGLGFEYTIKKHPRAKHIRISVRKDGSVTVTVPKRVAKKHGEAFVREKADWIRKRIEEQENSPSGLLLRGSEEEYQQYKEAARTLVHRRLEELNQVYGFEYGRVSIRNQRTRWGSCSAKGNLNFNYRIVFLTPQQQDYIVAHELCHLQQMNHSPAFWELVEQAIPNARVIAREVRAL